MNKTSKVISVLSSDSFNASQGLVLVVAIAVIATIAAFLLINLFNKSKTAL